ncbi:MAG: class I SAM-dependent methyltransferase [Bacteroidota bacterium]
MTKNTWLQFWNERYTKPEYAYGTAPNVFLKEQLEQLEKKGTILFGAEGEGRNAVYAAQMGWTVSAFDISEAGREKALQLAKKKEVQIDYQVGELPDLQFEAAPFDAIALIYAHFPPALQSSYHRLLDTHLRIGGYIIFEAFGKNHLPYRMQNPKVGGPADLAMLFSVEKLKSDFKNYNIHLLREEVIVLDEGSKHIGKGSVVRFVGQKMEKTN